MIVIVMGLFFASPPALIVGHLLGGGVALVVHRKQPMIKLVFNLSHFALEACVALVTFQVVLGAHHGFGPRAWLAGFAAGCCSWWRWWCWSPTGPMRPWSTATPAWRCSTSSPRSSESHRVLKT